MSHRDEYSQWPFLTEEEFELACAFLDSRYTKAKLGPVRKGFKLRSRRTATTGATSIEILRLLNVSSDDGDLSELLDQLWDRRADGASASDMEVDMPNEDQDNEVLLSNTDTPPQYSMYAHQPYVVYEIHLHPTYRVPTLWFTLHDLPMAEPTFDLNSVFRYLVPDEHKAQLRAAGVTGGISAAPHPITDLPSFFIHPCQTKEAMEPFDCEAKDYLMVWLGLVGGCVGLWVPRELAET
ncbi:hypothetical protein BP5796_10450 [Coleophoma crateriformis]|uniref:Ubiquitin-like-conjugating enzyme ATG10 n=1 Tax=Coleophoma crateriformis TaxID=565419 RepID=A0A3D8QQK7_9HELO|nr:hypothetical protein BP5796_10450 [Coleophoma crateriformis]